DVGVRRTSLAVLAAPPGPVPEPLAPAEPALPADPPAVLPAEPALPWSPPVVMPSARSLLSVWLPADACWPVRPFWAFTKALLGRRVPQAGRTRARMATSRNSLWRRSACTSGARRPPTIPPEVTRCMARTTVGIRSQRTHFLARAPRRLGGRPR